MSDYPRPPYPAQQQDQVPGRTEPMNPQPDHGEITYKGSGKLTGKAAIITGGDSGIGRAVAIAFAREGADVLVAYLDEDDDAQVTVEHIEAAGQRGVSFRGDLAERSVARELVAKAVESFGKIDILVNNAAHQMSFDSIEDISDDEWDKTFDINIGAMFRIVKSALPHIPAGGSIINTTSVNADFPNPSLLAYATTKGAIQNFTGGLAQILAEKDIRVNCVAPGPVWTPLIPATMPADAVKEFGSNYPMKRAAQPAELAAPYVLLASDEASFVSGATIAVTGGKPFI